MLERGDIVVYLLLLLIGGIWIVFRYRNRRKPVYGTHVPTSGKVIQLLRDEGYDIISGKIKLPFHMSSENNEHTSFLVADFIVKFVGRTYVVKIERKRKETNRVKQIQERYLPYCLAFNADGIVIVNSDKQELERFELDARPYASRSYWKSIVISFIVGVVVTFFWLY